MCFTSEYINGDGYVHYNSGCLSEQVLFPTLMYTVSDYFHVTSKLPIDSASAIPLYKQIPKECPYIKY